MTLSPGRIIYEHLPERLRQRILFPEDQWDVLEHSDRKKHCRLLMLHVIADICGEPYPWGDAESG